MRDHHSFFLLYSIISLFSISYRHSLYLSFGEIESEIKMQNIWLKHYDTIQWGIIIPPSSSSFIHHSTLFLFIQTLTTLDLTFNKIGDQVAQYLGEALRNNSVRDHHSFFFFFFVLYSSFHAFSFHTDTHYTPPWAESNRSSRCTISGWSITTQYSERSSLLLPPLFHHFMRFHFIQTLSTLILQCNQIGDKGAQYLAEALRNNSVRDHHSFCCFFFFFFLYSIISLFSISYRHSLHSTLSGIKSETKVHNIWLKWKWKIQIWNFIGDFYGRWLCFVFLLLFYGFQLYIKRFSCADLPNRKRLYFRCLKSWVYVAERDEMCFLYVAYVNDSHMVFISSDQLLKELNWNRSDEKG